MEHSELVQEMALLEKLTAPERLQHAKRRRQQQIANWIQCDISLDNGTTISSSMIDGTLKLLSNELTAIKPSGSKNLSVQFPENIVLLEGKYSLLFVFYEFFW